jgi:hypothetical protein
MVNPTAFYEIIEAAGLRWRNFDMTMPELYVGDYHWKKQRCYIAE